MEQYDSYLLQALASTGLIAALANNDYLNDQHFNNLKFDNESFKKNIFQSGIGNPATLQMFLYALLVATYEMNKGHSLNMKFEQLNAFIDNLAINKCSNYPSDTAEFQYVKHLRNAVAHSKTYYFVNENVCYVTFTDNYKNNNCEFTFKTSDIGKILEELQKIILNYLKKTIKIL